MKNVLDEIRKKAKRSEKDLYKLYDEVHKEIADSGFNEGESEFWTNKEYETDDRHDGEKCVERYGHKVWIFDTWVGSTNIPENKQELARFDRYPVRNVALWYTPYCYSQERFKPMRFTPQELYDKAETEKILYEDYYVKVSMLRRNVIPFFNSTSWSHKMARHEYVMYLKQDMPSKRQENAMKALVEEINANVLRFKNGEITQKERCEINTPLWRKKREIETKARKPVEVFHADTLDGLFVKARMHFNNWYED